MPGFISENRLPHNKLFLVNPKGLLMKKLIERQFFCFMIEERAGEKQ
jgi:hypothetical protein